MVKRPRSSIFRERGHLGIEKLGSGRTLDQVTVSVQAELPTVRYRNDHLEHGNVVPGYNRNHPYRQSLDILDTMYNMVSIEASR